MLNRMVVIADCFFVCVSGLGVCDVGLDFYDVG